MGLIQRVLIDMVVDRAGIGAKQAVFAKAGVDLNTVFRIDRDYDDAEALRLFASAAEVLGINQQEAMRAYADAFVGDMLRRFPVFFEIAPNAYAFSKRQPSVHGCIAAGVGGPEVRDRVTSKFTVTEETTGLLTHYRSPNRLAALYVALATRIVQHYGEDASVTPLDDLTDEACRIRIAWPDLGGLQ